MIEFILECIIEFVIELIGGLSGIIFEGGKTVAANKKHSKWIRYPVLLLAGVIYLGIIAFFVLVGFHVLADGLWRAIVMWFFGFAFIVVTIWSFRTEYIKRKKEHD